MLAGRAMSSAHFLLAVAVSAERALFVIGPTTWLQETAATCFHACERLNHMIEVAGGHSLV